MASLTSLRREVEMLNRVFSPPHKQRITLSWLIGDSWEVNQT